MAINSSLFSVMIHKALCIVAAIIFLSFGGATPGRAQTKCPKTFDTLGVEVVMRGSKIDYSAFRVDTIITKDQVNGSKLVRLLDVYPEPIKLNGKPVANYKLQPAPFFKSKYDNSRLMIMNTLKKDIMKLEDGLYILDISKIILDEQGNVCYYFYGGIRKSRTMGPSSAADVDPALQQYLYEQIVGLMEHSPGYLPVKKDGAAIINMMNPSEFWAQFRVKDHQVFDMNSVGQWVLLQ